MFYFVFKVKIYIWSRRVEHLVCENISLAIWTKPTTVIYMDVNLIFF